MDIRKHVRIFIDKYPFIEYIIDKWAIHSLYKRPRVHRVNLSARVFYCALCWKRLTDDRGTKVDSHRSEAAFI